MLARVGELRGGTDESPSLEDGIILDTDMQMSDTGLPEAGPISLGNAQPKREAPAMRGLRNTAERVCRHVLVGVASTPWAA